MKLKIFHGSILEVECQYNQWCKDKDVADKLFSITDNIVVLAVWYKEKPELKYVCNKEDEVIK
jgi:lipopolysaccharide biosynthesis glycosyltransferase